MMLQIDAEREDCCPEEEAPEVKVNGDEAEEDGAKLERCDTEEGTVVYEEYYDENGNIREQGSPDSSYNSSDYARPV